LGIVTIEHERVYRRGGGDEEKKDKKEKKDKMSILRRPNDGHRGDQQVHQRQRIKAEMGARMIVNQTQRLYVRPSQRKHRTTQQSLGQSDNRYR